MIDFARRASFLLRWIFQRPHSFTVVENGHGEAVGAELEVEHYPFLNRRGIEKACKMELTRQQLIHQWRIRANALQIISTGEEKQCRSTGLRYKLTIFQPIRIGPESALSD